MGAVFLPEARGEKWFLALSSFRKLLWVLVVAAPAGSAGLSASCAASSLAPTPDSLFHLSATLVVVLGSRVTSPSQDVHLITSAESRVPRLVTQSQVLGLRMRTSLGTPPATAPLHHLSISGEGPAGICCPSILLLAPPPPQSRP